MPWKLRLVARSGWSYRHRSAVDFLISGIHLGQADSPRAHLAAERLASREPWQRLYPRRRFSVQCFLPAAESTLDGSQDVPRLHTVGRGQTGEEKIAHQNVLHHSHRTGLHAQQGVEALHR